VADKPRVVPQAFQQVSNRGAPCSAILGRSSARSRAGRDLSVQRRQSGIIPWQRRLHTGGARFISNSYAASCYVADLEIRTAQLAIGSALLLRHKLQQRSFHLDDQSRATIGRFIIKLTVSALLAAYGKADYVPAMAAWISIYAVLTSVVALILKERFVRESFNHWDETLWLVFLTLALTVLSSLLPQT
jgi:hypothetical protein